MTADLDLAPVDLETGYSDSPPCEFVVNETMEDCGKPSVARVHAVDACGCVKINFVCQECLADLEADEVECATHLAPVVEWHII
jgi:hypothetical protein